MSFLFAWAIAFCFVLAFTLALVARGSREAINLARGLLIAGVILLAWFLAGCSSPTAPSSTRIFGWTAAPGCSPELPIPSRKGEPLITLKVPGSPQLQAIWVDADGTTLTVNFTALGSGLFLVCDWSTK